METRAFFLGRNFYYVRSYWTIFITVGETARFSGFKFQGLFCGLLTFSLKDPRMQLRW